MDGHEYERQCARMLMDKGFSNVRVTPGSGDQGIDVIAYSGNKKYGIQCKYYSSPVGNHAVQEAFAGARFYECDVAAVLTNNTFTPSAIELSRKTGVLLWSNNKVPRVKNDNKGFFLTRVIGIASMLLGLIALGAMWGAGEIGIVSMTTLSLWMLTLIFGGFFAAFENGNWGMSFASSFFYLLFTLTVLFIFVFSPGTEVAEFFLFFLVITFIFCIRTDYLHKKTNGYHIWEDGFKRFLHDIFERSKFRKEESAEACESKKMDEYTIRAGKLAAEYGSIKISIIQRTFQIGYIRASNIASELCEMGVIERSKEHEDTYNAVVSIESFINMIDEST